MGAGATEPAKDQAPAVSGAPPEPGRVEACAARVFTNRLLAPLYSRYVDQMGLRGDERVLDYGSGSGAAARHLAARLSPDGHLTCVDISERWQKTLRSVLRAYPTVELRLGDIRSMELTEESYDVVLVHWMLHDVAPWDRPGIVAKLAGLLRPGGRLFSREPTNAKHGMPAAQLRELYAAAGLTEALAAEGKAPILGEYYRAVWTKPGA
jgi:ubiquinone/menaquinone biosynthesis C-methylase UbiE